MLKANRHCLRDYCLFEIFAVEGPFYQWEIVGAAVYGIDESQSGPEHSDGGSEGVKAEQKERCSCPWHRIPYQGLNVPGALRLV